MFTILDGVTVEQDGRTLSLAPKLRLLLAVLLSRLGQPVSVPELVDAIWKGRPPASAGENLRQYVHELRKALGADLLVRRDAAYCLTADAQTLDAHRFRRLINAAEAAAAGGDLNEARRLFRAGLALWRDRPFGAFHDEPSLATYVLQLEEQRLAALERRFEVELDLGAHSGLVAELTALAVEHPYREHLRGQLMVALYRSGRQVDALRVYRDLRMTLVTELGIEPSPALDALQAAMLRNDSALTLRFPAQDIGAPPVVPAELPPTAGYFNGRTDELKRLHELAADAERPAAPVITVVGQPGVGKTALVVRWAHEVGADFPDGLLFLDLRGFHRLQPMVPAEAIGHLLTSLGVAADAVPAGLEDGVKMYRSMVSARRVLIVLDNARSAAQVRDLLPGGPGAVTVVTSRHRLTGLVAGSGARQVILRSLTSDDAVGLLRRMLGAERVHAEPAAAVELADACGRLPLALCITAALLAEDPTRSITKHLAELRGDRLAALELDGDGDFRLTATFDTSYDALDEPERRTFRLLGIIPGNDFTPGTVAAVTDETVESARRVLLRLARAHLVEPRADNRYALHDLLREYAHRRASAADPDEVEAALARLYAYFLRRCGGAAQALYPEVIRLPYPSETAGEPDHLTAAEAVDWLHAERGNLVAVCLHAAANGPQPAAWQLADLLRGFFFGRRVEPDWFAVATAAAGAAATAGDSRGQAMAELSLGNFYYRSHDYPMALARYAAMLRLSRETSWLQCEAAAESAAGSAYSDSGDLILAAEHYERSLAIARRAGLRPVGTVYNNLAGVLLSQGHLAKADEHCRTALEIFREQGSRAGEALTRENFALVLCLRGFPEDAREQATEALRIAEELDNQRMIAYAWVNLAIAGRDAGDLVRSAEHAERALDLSAAAHDVALECQAHNALAQTLRAIGKVDEAIAHHEAALRLARSISDKYIEIESMTGLADAYVLLRRLDEAAASASSAVARARGAGYRLLLARALTTLADVYRHSERPVDADEATREAALLQRETGCQLPSPSPLSTPGPGR